MKRSALGGALLMLAGTLVAAVLQSPVQAEPPAEPGKACGRPGAAHRVTAEQAEAGLRIRQANCDLRGASIVVDGLGGQVPEPGDFVLAETLTKDGAREVRLSTEAGTGDVLVTSGHGKRDDSDHPDEQTTTGGSTTSSLFCGGTGSVFDGEYWRTTPRYYINGATYPRYASQADWVSRVQNAANVYANGINRCGYANHTSPYTALTYAGDTTRKAAIPDDNSVCGSEDGASVVSGGDLPNSPTRTLASSCQWGSSINTSLREADIKVDGFDAPWVAPGTSCQSGQFDLYSVVTHEFGHFLGFNHVSESTRPTLVMSPNIASCEQNRRLGDGDHRGLTFYYP